MEKKKRPGRPKGPKRKMVMINLDLVLVKQTAKLNRSEFINMLVNKHFNIVPKKPTT